MHPTEEDGPWRCAALGVFSAAADPDGCRSRPLTRPVAVSRTPPAGDTTPRLARLPDVRASDAA